MTGLLALPKIDPPQIPLIPGPPQVPMIPLSKTAQAKNEEAKGVGMSGGGVVPGPAGKDGKDGIAMAGGGLVPGYEGGAEVLGEHSIERTEDGGVEKMSTTGGINSAGGLDETSTVTYNKTITEADGTVTTFEEKKKMREQIASIGVPDLIEHQDQLLNEIHKLKGFENVTIDQVINQQTGIPQKELLPILLRSDAQKATSDKEDKAHQEDLKARGIKPGQSFSISAYDEVGRSLAGTMGYQTGQTKPDQLVSSRTTYESSSKESFKTPGSNPLSDLSESINVSAKMSGGGIVPGPYPTTNLLGMGHNVINTAPGNIIGYNKGGKVPGSGNGDTVPAMLTPGEFVMSKGAVNMIGADKLMAMNAAGGGTNQPKLMKFAGGGRVPDIDTPRSRRRKVTMIRAGGNQSSPQMLGGGGSGNQTPSFSSTDSNNMSIPVIKSLYNMMG